MSGGQRLSPVAVASIVASAACFTIIDTIVKYLGNRYSAPVLVLARWGVPALVIVMLLGPRLRWKLLGRASPGLHVARAGALILSSLAFFSALRFLPLAEATGLNYCTPAIVTVLAVWLLRERHSRSRWMFVAAGCIGIVLIVRPGESMLHASALLALAAAGLNATFQILTRKLAEEDFIVLLFYPSVVGAVLISVTIPFVQYDMSLMTEDLALLLAIGVLGGLGHCLFVHAFKHAPASAIAPFMYFQLILSTLAGWLAFDALPDGWALAGMAVIALGAVFVAWSECRTVAAEGLEWTHAAAIAPMMLFGTCSAPSQSTASRVGFAESRRGFDAVVPRLDVGESMAFVDGAGVRRTILRTD